mgnify:CR=1 FL=1
MNRFYRRITYCSILFTLSLAACTSTPPATPIPTAAFTLVPSLASTETLTPTPSPTPESTAESTLDPDATPEPTQITLTIEPVTGQKIPPPIDITLPTGWQFGYDTVVQPDLDGLRLYPVAVYTGTLEGGGQGTIIVVWGFANMTAGNPITGAAEIDLWADGLRLWRLLINEVGCTVGTDLRRDFTIGDRAAVGTEVSAVNCPREPDATGWFGALQVDGLNFAFYAFTDPQSILGSAQDELQAILDTVSFRVTDYLTATPVPQD